MKSTYIVLVIGTLALITLAQSALGAVQNKTTKNMTAGAEAGNSRTGAMKNTTITGNTSTNSNVTAASVTTVIYTEEGQPLVQEVNKPANQSTILLG